MPVTPKHILFLMIDDLGFNDISYRNTSDLSSPHIDKLANAGIKLERYYTHNLCSPSRTSFLSGRFASTISNQGCVIVNGQAVDLPRNVSTVADRLSQHGTGFATAAFGKVRAPPYSYATLVLMLAPSSIFVPCALTNAFALYFRSSCRSGTPG